MPDFPVQFENARALWLILLIIPVVMYGWRNLTGMAPLRRGIVCGMRSLVILLIAVTVAEPKWMQESDALTVVLLVDRSKSISPELDVKAANYLRDATVAGDEDGKRRPIDRLAIINVGGNSLVDGMPSPWTMFESNVPVVLNRDATNLAEGVRLGMAIAPRNTAVRFVLISDGNETVDSVMNMADIAMANEIPIDVLPLRYEHTSEVLFERVMAPAQARRGQNIAVKAVLRAEKPMRGTLTLIQNKGQANERVLDLDPGNEGVGRIIDLEAGINTEIITLNMDHQGPQRFDAHFEPEDEADDGISTNNYAQAVVVVGGEGRVLIIDERPEETGSLRQALDEARIDIDHLMPHEIGSDVLALSAYDAIVLANVPAHAMSGTVHEALRRYVHDVGGGLLMIGGPNSFGAGGWIDTPVAKAMPVKMDPPEKREMPRGALVAIMHSCEMPQGNYWGEQCAIAAVNALSRLDLAGVIDYSWGAGGGQNGCVWQFPLQEVGDKSAAIAAIKKMTMGDMPDFTPAMEMAVTALSNVGGQRHVIIISDGDPQKPSRALLQKFVDNQITISTIVAGGHNNAIDAQNMQWVAKFTGGTYYPQQANNPSNMPQIFIKEAMVIRRTLIVEGETYGVSSADIVTPGPFMVPYSALPTVDGYVLTAPRPSAPPEMVTSLGDPLFASWQYGLGKSVAFTSDATSRWGAQWQAWSEFQQFWEQTIRWSMRSPAPPNLTLNTRVEGGKGIIEVEAQTDEGGFANFGSVAGVVISPSLKSKQILLQQTGPGTWLAEFDADEPGSWVVNMIRKEPDGASASIQAGIAVPYSHEYRHVRDNSALLTKLAERTRGRILDGTDPTTANLFDRQQLPTPQSLSEMWPLTAIIAAMLFLLDVATRRLAIDVIALRRNVAELFGMRASTAGEGMQRLKQAREDVKHRRNLPDDADEPVDSAAVASRRFEVEEGSGATDMLDLDAETGDGAAPIRRKPKPQTSLDDTPSDDDDDGSYTSRLLQAKRRARGEDQSDDGGSTNG